MMTNRSDHWQLLRSGRHTMATWIGDDQVTYLAVRGAEGWLLTRKVAGAGALVLGGPTATLREAKALAADDAAQGL
jgi:hypothetical protein